MANERMKITKADVEKAIDTLKTRILTIMDADGDGAFASTLEAMGAVIEETDEFKEAVRKGDETFRNEALDVAVASLFARISYDAYEEAGELTSFIK